MQGNVTSEATFERIDKWVDECTRLHPMCFSLSDFSIPHRLIDPGTPRPPRGVRPMRLVENLNWKVKYIALSHCWGGQQTFTTKKSNIRGQMAEIRWNELPKTYRDAVSVARRLHVRYLWIDSVCIFQDDRQDWEIESSKMMSIYEGSFLTLAAALAPGDSGGFLGPQEEPSLFASKPVLGHQGVRIRVTHDYLHLTCEEVLATRAWTLQETLLLPRLLSFSLGAPVPVSREKLVRVRLRPVRGSVPRQRAYRGVDRSTYQDCLSGKMRRRQIHSFWMNGILAPYNNRGISKHSDRFPAISALATKFQQVLKDDEYVAGIWLRDVLRGLGWYSRPDSGWNLDACERAPSWSWASVEGPIATSTLRSNCPRPNMRAHFKDCTVIPKGLNATGEVEGGSMEIKGPTLHGCLLVQNNPSLSGPESLSYRLIVTYGADDQEPIDLASGRVHLDTPVCEVEVPLRNGDAAHSLNRSPLAMQQSTGGLVSLLMLYQEWGNGEVESGEILRTFLILGRKPGKVMAEGGHLPFYPIL